MKKHIPPLLATLAFSAMLGVTSCTTLQDVKSQNDLVFGDDFYLPVERPYPSTPQRILFLPATGNTDPLSTRHFVETFYNRLSTNPQFQVMVADSNMIAGRGLSISEAEAFALAEKLKCDTILAMDLGSHHALPPLRIRVNFILHNTIDRSINTKILAVYDAQNRATANSARRYFKSKLQAQYSGEKSEAVLQNNHLFMTFAAEHLHSNFIRALQDR